MGQLSIPLWELLVGAGIVGLGALIILWVVIQLRNSELRHRDLTRRLSKLMDKLD